MRNEEVSQAPVRRLSLAGTVTSLHAWARQVRSGTLDLIVVDYLELMRAEHPTGNRVEDVSAFSAGSSSSRESSIGP